MNGALPPISESPSSAPNFDGAPLRSVHTSNLPQLLSQACASLLVTTYQAGKLVILRNQGGVLNTHFRNFAKPMGLALQGPRLAIGTNLEIWEFRNVPAVCRRLDKRSEQAAARGESDASEVIASPAFASETPRSSERTPCRHDACYLPRRSHTTGEVQIHEMAWAGEELWFVNTAFSCLATRSEEFSFTPRWRPTFVDKLLPGDCCHLNGLAVREGRVRYVTALGTTNEPGGWRQNKRNGGVLIDVETNEVVVRNLSMPHSPRWHRDQLWLLESGDGSLGRVDLATGRYEAVVKLPGFTRGLTFLGPYALVGLSQVRESAVFSGIPLVDRLEDRHCGVWVVDLERGEVAAYVQFEDAVQEIFAVETLKGSLFPDLINHDPDLIGLSYILPEEALHDVPPELRNIN